MKTLEFVDGLNTGVRNIDDQHRSLVDMINILIKAQNGESCPETVSFILAEMGKYVYLHFRDEEQFMYDHGFAGLEEHRKVHFTFSEKVDEFTKLYDSGQTDLLIENLNFLSNWLLDHIQGDDQDMVRSILDN